MPFFDDARNAWIRNGGPPAIADTMAAIASAETSSGTNLFNPRDSNGYPSYGAWQINGVNLGEFGIPSTPGNLTHDLNANAQAAVAIWRAQGLNAWGTYNPRDGSTPKYLAYMPGVLNGLVGQPAAGGGGGGGGGAPGTAAALPSGVTVKGALGQVKLGFAPQVPSQYIYIVVVTLGLLLLFIALSGKKVERVN